MKVSHRLYLATLPSVVGIVLVAALAYWGQYSRAVPEIFLIVAAATTVASVAMSWVNVRYVAERVGRLSHRRSQEQKREHDQSVVATHVSPRSDELDEIEGEFENLSKAVQITRNERDREERLYQHGTARYASLLATVSAIAVQRLDEVRLPLHILLDNHFGELNENQEELLAAARTSAERADIELVALHRIAELDLGIRTLRHDRVYPADLLHAVLPIIQSIASQNAATLQADVAPLVPAIRGDAAQLQEAMVVLLGETIATASEGAELQLNLIQDGGAVTIRLSGAGRYTDSVRSVLAERVIQASGGTCEYSAAGLIVTLHHEPVAGATTGFSK